MEYNNSNYQILIYKMYKIKRLKTRIKIKLTTRFLIDYKNQMMKKIN